MYRWLPVCRPLLALACLVWAPSCSGYEPQGQFWPPDSGVLAVGGGSTLAQSGAGNGAAAAAGSGGLGGLGTSGSNATSGGAAVGGSDLGAGSDSTGGTLTGGTNFGGSNPVAGAGPVGGGNGGTNPVGGAGSVGGGGPIGGASSSGCSLHVTVTTTAPGGNYQPRNVGAIWVSDATGRFVKSLEVWAAKRITRVVAWNAATKNAGVAGNKVDAVTSATLSSHRMHDVSWNCRDYNGQVVPDGEYRVYFEVADSNNGGPNVFETFSKGASASTMTASMGNFQGIALTFTP